MWSFFSRPAAAEPFEAVGRVLDGLFTFDKERLSKTAALARVAQQPALVQAEINKIEAAHIRKNQRSRALGPPPAVLPVAVF